MARHIYLAAGLLFAVGALLASPARSDDQAPAQFRGRTVAEWQRVLESPRPEERRAAVSALEALGSLAKVAAPDLAKALVDLDEESAEGAYRCLVKLGPEAAAAKPALLKYESDLDPKLRIRASLLLVMMEHKDEQHPARLARVMLRLADYGGPYPYVSYLLSQTKIEAPVFSEPMPSQIAGLGKAERLQVARELLKLLSTSEASSSVDLLIYYYLLLTADADSLDDELIAFLKKTISGSDQPGCVTAIQSLPHFASRPGGEKIRRLVAAELKRHFAGDSEVHKAAVESAARLGILVEELNDALAKEVAEANSNWALEQLEVLGPAARPVLPKINKILRAAKHEFGFGRGNSRDLVLHANEGREGSTVRWDGMVSADRLARTIWKIGGVDFLPTVRASVKDANPLVGLVAVEVLAESKNDDPTTIAALEQAIAKGEFFLELRAVEALGELGKSATSTAPALERIAKYDGRRLTFKDLGMTESYTSANGGLDLRTWYEQLLRVRAALAWWQVSGSPEASKILGSLVFCRSREGEATQIVNMEALSALRKLGADAAPATAEIVKALDYLRVEDILPDLSAYETLASIGPKAEQAAAALRRIFADKKQRWEFRVGAAYALWRITGSAEGAGTIVESYSTGGVFLSAIPLDYLAKMGPTVKNFAPQIAQRMFERRDSNYEHEVELLRKIDPAAADALKVRIEAERTKVATSQTLASKLREIELQRIESTKFAEAQRKSQGK